MVSHECQQERVVAQLSRNVSISILWVPPPHTMNLILLKSRGRFCNEHGYNSVLILTAAFFISKKNKTRLRQRIALCSLFFFLPFLVSVSPCLGLARPPTSPNLKNRTSLAPVPGFKSKPDSPGIFRLPPSPPINAARVLTLPTLFLCCNSFLVPASFTLKRLQSSTSA